jgi:hypothetical protein
VLHGRAAHFCLPHSEERYIRNLTHLFIQQRKKTMENLGHAPSTCDRSASAGLETSNKSGDTCVRKPVEARHTFREGSCVCVIRGTTDVVGIWGRSSSARRRRVRLQ